jgi:hypothetical protein
MALTPVWCEGWEHGVISSNGTGLANVVTATRSSIQSPGRSGTYCLRLAPDDSGTGQWQRNITTTAKPFAIFAAKVQTDVSSGEQKLFRLPLTTGGQSCPTLTISNTGVLTMKVDNGSGGAATGPGISDGNWHVIAMQVDVSGTTWTVDWWVDGVAQTQATEGSHSADTASSWAIGTNDANGPGYTIDVDDVLIATWATAGTDYITNIEVLGYSVGSDGTHNAGTTVFINGDSATSPNFTNSTTDAYTYLDDIPFTTIRSTTDNVSAETHSAGAYMELVVAATASGKPDALAVVALLAYSSPSSSANNGNATVVRTSAGSDNEIFGNFTTGADYSETSNFFKGILVPDPGGWDKTELDQIKFRIGRASNSSDVSPRPTWQNLMIQVAYEIESGTAHSLAGTADGTSTTTAVLSPTFALAGTSDGTSTTAAALSLGFFLAGTADGTSTAAGNLVLAFHLAGTADGTSTISATIFVAKLLQGTADGTSSAAAALTYAAKLAASADGVSTTAADLILAFNMAAAADGIATTNGTLNVDWLLAAIAAGVTTASGTLYVLEGGQVPIVSSFPSIFFLLLE